LLQELDSHIKNEELNENIELEELEYSELKIIIFLLVSFILFSPH